LFPKEIISILKATRLAFLHSLPLTTLSPLSLQPP
jgi:hypothetical protein